jgi:nucleotide-binding universal stress UspA family protein
MSAHQHHQGIIVGVDGSPASLEAVQWAARDAQMRNIALKIVHVVAPIVTCTTQSWSGVPIPDDYSALQEEQAAKAIELAHSTAVAAAPSHAELISSEVLHEPTVPALVELSKHAEMLVLGCRGHGRVAQVLLGSISAGAVQYAHCPVAVIHHDEPSPTPSPNAPVVVGIDGSPTSELAAEIAFDEASRRDVDLVALHAWSDMNSLGIARVGWAPIEWCNIQVQEEELLAERLCGWTDRYPDVVVHKEVVCDQPALRLLKQAEKAQLLVVGSHGRGGFPGMLLGSVSTAVVNAARIPVIIARTPRNA